MVLIEVSICQISNPSHGSLELPTLVEIQGIRSLPISHQNALISVSLQSGKRQAVISFGPQPYIQYCVPKRIIIVLKQSSFLCKKNLCVYALRC